MRRIFSWHYDNTSFNPRWASSLCIESIDDTTICMVQYLRIDKPFDVDYTRRGAQSIYLYSQVFFSKPLAPHQASMGAFVLIPSTSCIHFSSLIGISMTA